MTVFVPRPTRSESRCTAECNACNTVDHDIGHVFIGVGLRTLECHSIFEAPGVSQTDWGYTRGVQPPWRRMVNPMAVTDIVAWNRDPLRSCNYRVGGPPQ